MNAIVLYSPLTMTGVLALVFHLLPRLSRSEIYFAVTVPGAFPDGPEARRVLLRYRLQVWVHALVAAGLILLAWNLGRPGLITLGIGWQLFGYITAFLLARLAVQPHAVAADSRREAEIRPRAGGLPGGWPGQLAPFLLLSLIGLLVYMNWNTLPDRWPVHWGIDGQPDRWADRTPRAVFGPLAGIGVMCALMFLIALGILHRSRRIEVTGAPAASERAFQRAILWLLLGVECFLVLHMGGLQLWPLWSGPANPDSVAWLAVGVIPLVMLAVFFVFVRIGQGGSRLEPSPVRERPVGDRTRDDCWKLGLFYVNRADAAVFVEKRFGIGYTVNFGNYWVWIGLAFVLALPLLTAILRENGG
jgi:uncharacterized membrane protein